MPLHQTWWLVKYRAAIWSFFPFLKLTALYFTISDIVHEDLYKVGTIGTTRLLLEGLLVRPKEQTHAEFYGACPVFVTTYLHTFLSRILNEKKYLPSFLCFFCCCLYLCVWQSNQNLQAIYHLDPGSLHWSACAFLGSHVFLFSLRWTLWCSNSIFLSHTDESSKDETRVCGCNFQIDEK